jgi:DNA-binding FrmR family transcriptional regulator
MEAIERTVEADDECADIVQQALAAEELIENCSSVSEEVTRMIHE